MAAAVKAAAKFLNNAVKPVLVGGVKLRTWGAQEAFMELADAGGYPVAIQPHAKGLVPESYERFIGERLAFFPFWHLVAWKYNDTRKVGDGGPWLYT